jgi:hypothetical protein
MTSRAPAISPHCPPSQTGPTRGVPEISIHGTQSPLSLPPSPDSLPESFPNRLHSGRPDPPEILKPTFKTQQHFGHGCVQVLTSPRGQGVDFARDSRPIFRKGPKDEVRAVGPGCRRRAQ